MPVSKIHTSYNTAPEFKISHDGKTYKFTPEQQELFVSYAVFSTQYAFKDKDLSEIDYDVLKDNGYFDFAQEQLESGDVAASSPMMYLVMLSANVIATEMTKDHFEHVIAPFNFTQKIKRKVFAMALLEIFADFYNQIGNDVAISKDDFYKLLNDRSEDNDVDNDNEDEEDFEVSDETTELVMRLITENTDEDGNIDVKKLQEMGVIAVNDDSNDSPNTDEIYEMLAKEINNMSDDEFEERVGTDDITREEFIDMMREKGDNVTMVTLQLNKDFVEKHEKMLSMANAPSSTTIN